MTHEERIAYLKSCDETITPAQLSMVLGGNPYTYNLMAKRGELTLPHMFRGRHLRIFTAGVIKALEGVQLSK